MFGFRTVCHVRKPNASAVSSTCLESALVSPAKLLEDLQSDDALTVLRAVRALRELLETCERSNVLRLRSADTPWQEIAEALGRTRSSVWEKYNKPE